MAINQEVKKQNKKCKRTVKEQFIDWFSDKSLYSWSELVTNWMIVIVACILCCFATVTIAIYWIHLINAVKGVVPLWAWAPSWLMITISMLMLLELILLITKLCLRHRRRKYHLRSSIPEGLQNTVFGKAIDKKYESVLDKQDKHKRFY